jgi:hypothetical protein
MLGCTVGSEEYFTVGIEQGGRMLKIEDHQVRLDKKRFVIVISFRDPDAVLVNASFNPQSFRDAMAGRSIRGIAGFSGKQIREERFNKRKLIHVTERDFHYWNYFSEGSHKFDAAKYKRGAWVCHRTVLGYIEPGAAAPRDIRYLDKPEMYLVFVKPEWNRTRTRRIEKQREYLKLLFR